MEKPSFDAVYNQVAWELCVEAAAKAKAELAFSFFHDRNALYKAIPVASIQVAADKLIENCDGGIRILGTWIAGGKQGTLDVICCEQFAPTVTETYVVRFIEDMIRMQIAKKLFSRGSPTIESLEGKE